jgi:hypothetical protein
LFLPNVFLPSVVVSSDTQTEGDSQTATHPKYGDDEKQLSQEQVEAHSSQVEIHISTSTCNFACELCNAAYQKYDFVPCIV